MRPASPARATAVATATAVALATVTGTAAATVTGTAAAGRWGPCAHGPAGRTGPGSLRSQTVSAVPRTASTASTTNPANQARIVMYAVAGTGWWLIRLVPIRVIW